jgi:hypothetical protein
MQSCKQPEKHGKQITIRGIKYSGKEFPARIFFLDAVRFENFLSLLGSEFIHTYSLGFVKTRQGLRC